MASLSIGSRCFLGRSRGYLTLFAVRFDDLPFLCPKISRSNDSRRRIRSGSSSSASCSARSPVSDHTENSESDERAEEREDRRLAGRSPFGSSSSTDGPDERRDWEDKGRSGISAEDADGAFVRGMLAVGGGLVATAHRGQLSRRGIESTIFETTPEMQQCLSAARTTGKVQPLSE